MKSMVQLSIAGGECSTTFMKFVNYKACVDIYHVVVIHVLPYYMATIIFLFWNIHISLLCEFYDLVHATGFVQYAFLGNIDMCF